MRSAEWLAGRTPRTLAISSLVLSTCGALSACGTDAGPETGTGGIAESTGGAETSGGAFGVAAGGTSSGGATGEAPAGGAPGSGGGLANVGGASSGGAGGGSSQGDGGSLGSGGSLSASGGAHGSGGETGSGGSGNACPFDGKITYSLARADSPSQDQADAYERITNAIEKALSIYNCYTDIEKALNVQYNPSVATADGNPNGSIRFGSRASMNFVTAMHEISHVLGVGADGAYDPLIVGGVYTGPIATAKLRELTGDPSAEIHGDTQHFWPYGLNYESEYESEQDGINHCYLVTAIREDIGWD